MVSNYKVAFTSLTAGALIGGLSPSVAATAGRPHAPNDYFVPHTAATASTSIWRLNTEGEQQDAFHLAVVEFFNGLQLGQRRLPSDIEQVLCDSSWELYSRTE